MNDMKGWRMNNRAIGQILGGVAIAGLMAVTFAGPASAQRDPAYQQARASGAIGEQTDGYLGFVKSPTPAIKAMVDDINIKRKAAYTQQARANGATVEQFAFTTACRLIAQTEPNEKYQAPDGSWQTRGSSPPIRDSRCP